MRLVQRGTVSFTLHISVLVTPWSGNRRQREFSFSKPPQIFTYLFGKESGCDIDEYPPLWWEEKRCFLERDGIGKRWLGCVCVCVKYAIRVESPIGKCKSGRREVLDKLKSTRIREQAHHLWWRRRDVQHRGDLCWVCVCILRCKTTSTQYTGARSTPSMRSRRFNFKRVFSGSISPPAWGALCTCNPPLASAPARGVTYEPPPSTRTDCEYDYSDSDGMLADYISP